MRLVRLTLVTFVAISHVATIDIGSIVTFHQTLARTWAQIKFSATDGSWLATFGQQSFRQSHLSISYSDKIDTLKCLL